MKAKVLFAGILLFGVVALPLTAGATTIVEDTINFVTDDNPMGQMIQGFRAYGSLDTFAFSFWHPEGYPDVTIDPEGLVSASLTITVMDVADPGRMPIELVMVFTPGGSDSYWIPEGATKPLSLDVDIAPILETGGLEVVVVALLGEYYIQSSTATFVYEDQRPGAPVPEPGTMLLFGTGLIGMAVAMKRRRQPDRPV